MQKAGQNIQNWDDRYSEKISFKAIQSIFSHDHYRTSLKKYTKQITIPGAGKQGYCFVLQGECSFKFDNTIFNLKAGEYVELPSGDYYFSSSTDPTEIVRVWDLSKRN